VTGALAALLLASTAAGSTIEQAAVDLEQPADAATRLRRGEMLRSEPEEDSERELAVGLTFLVHKPPADVLQAFWEARDLKADDQLASETAIGRPGAPPDFAGLVPEPGRAAEVERYLVASPGDTLNLSADEIEAFHSLASPGNGFEPQVEEQLKRVLLARHRAYLQRGLAGMAPYARPSGPFEPSGELRRASQGSPLLQRHAPAMQRLLLSYPAEAPAGLEEHFYWLRRELDGRPNFALRHRLAIPVGDSWAIADREFYVSHGYNTSQAVALLIPVPEGSLVVYETRISTDQAAGVGSSLRKRIGRTVMAQQLTEHLRALARSISLTARR
jgi:hypothetical protein